MLVRSGTTVNNNLGHWTWKKSLMVGEGGERGSFLLDIIINISIRHSFVALATVVNYSGNKAI